MRSKLTKRLLVVEDDRPIAELLKHHFSAAGFTVTTTPSGDEALILIDEIEPDLVILDWMIEGLSGIEICRRLRRSRSTERLPIIMLTARGEEDDRVRGLETGADDFVSKPFSPKELVARASALLRRSAPNLVAEKLSYGGIELDVAAHRVRRDGETCRSVRPNTGSCSISSGRQNGSFPGSSSSKSFGRTMRRSSCGLSTS